MSKQKFIYVSPEGADQNDGSGPEKENALRTLQAAIDLAYTFIGDAVIKLADGEYPNTSATASGCRQGHLDIVGNIDHPERVKIDSGDDRYSAATIWAVEGAVLRLKGLHVSATKEDGTLLPSCLRATFNGLILLEGPMVFGHASYVHLLAGNGRIIVNHGYVVEGSARYHLFSSTSSAIATTTLKTEKVVLKNTPHFSGAFAAAQTSSVINWRLPFEGKATGCRHIISDAGCITMKSIGTDTQNSPDILPGDAEGINKCGFYNGAVYGTNLTSDSQKSKVFSFKKAV